MVCIHPIHRSTAGFFLNITQKIQRRTPQKSNIDTKSGYTLKESTSIQTIILGIHLLVFGGCLRQNEHSPHFQKSPMLLFFVGFCFRKDEKTFPSLCLCQKSELSPTHQQHLERCQTFGEDRSIRNRGARVVWVRNSQFTAATPPTSNIATCLKGDTSSKPSFLVSMFVFLGCNLLLFHPTN